MFSIVLKNYDISLAAHCRSHHLLVGVKLYKLKTAEIS
jgi:hypothetical protein